jgi:hypothetical protein
MENETQFLERNGWEVHCESPYDIYHPETESRASGYHAVYIIVNSLKKEEENAIIDRREEKLAAILSAYLGNKFDLEKFNLIVKEKAIEYADNLDPNTPNNMVDEHQWQISCEAFEKGAKSLLNPKNY